MFVLTTDRYKGVLLLVSIPVSPRLCSAMHCFARMGRRPLAHPKPLWALGSKHSSFPSSGQVWDLKVYLLLLHRCCSS